MSNRNHKPSFRFSNALNLSLLGLALSLALLGCGGGGGSGSTVGTAPNPQPPTPEGCTGSCVTAASLLSVADIQTVIAQAVNEAQGLGVNATIAVSDRVGNVLAVFRMTNARTQVTISSNRGVVGGLEGISIVPSELAAISKAVTGAYLSSEGNAFSTRTASQIVQEHFNPGEFGGPSGPLFGVQFSQLLCSDLIQAPAPALSALGLTGATTVGPKTSPLGLSADPGGFPLYKAGTVVGGIGVAADDNYGLDRNIFDSDRNVDEMIALAGTFNFGAPLERRGDRITADGKTFRYSDVEYADLNRPQVQAAAFASLPGRLIDVPGFYSAANIQAGTAFTTPASGIVADTQDFAGLDAFVLVDNTGAPRFRPKDGTDTLAANGSLKAAEVRTLLQEGLKIANAARAQIRTPTNSQARVTLSVVDTKGEILGVVRTRDAPVFGTDVSLQKARAAMFFSAPFAAAEIAALPDARYLNAQGAPSGQVIKFADYVSASRAFFSDQNFYTGQFAITPRAIGNIARPFYPDGIVGTPNGPLSKAFANWSPFTDGIQYDMVNNSVGSILGAYISALPAAGQSGSTPAQIQALLNGVVAVRTSGCTTNPRLKNGIQIFPGAVPIYRGQTLIGALGISGDGIDQDDMIAFLGVHNAGVVLNQALGHAPAAIRSDQLVPAGARLRYVQCPQAPFLNSNQQNVCEGK
jgi:uncharacterized protein GlcG (DUF336 family)